MNEPFTFREGELHCEQVPLAAIAAAAGTPAYVYSAAAMRGQARAFREALAGLDDPLIAFAVKANPNAAVLALMASEGLGADVVSGGEYRRARAAGIPAERIVYSGVGKTRDEMEEAIAGGVYQLNLESIPEVRTLSEAAQACGRTVRVAFRINPDVAAGSHAKISTGAAATKFGIPIGDARSAYALARDLPGLEVQGVAVHIGSQVMSLGPFEQAFERIGALIAELRADGHAIAAADLGGGLGIAQQPGLPPPPSPADYGAMAARAARGWDVRLVFEPGRVLVGSGGVVLTRVIRVKPGAERPFVIVDAAMNDLMRPSLYDAWHAVAAVRPRGGEMVADVVGPICESADSFAAARRIAEVEEGDLMVIESAGAYAATMASSYNSRPLAPEILVDGDRWAVVRPRQDQAAMTGGEIVPGWIGEARA